MWSQCIQITKRYQNYELQTILYYYTSQNLCANRNSTIFIEMINLSTLLLPFQNRIYFNFFIQKPNGTVQDQHSIIFIPTPIHVQNT